MRQNTKPIGYKMGIPAEKNNKRNNMEAIVAYASSILNSLPS